ncbi:hypothetical protein HZB01_05350 [Candidatus Woesearchaeota archaeon]|nr:hypothetical protein [Candidatus Woesearchaeota archaeon]
MKKMEDWQVTAFQEKGTYVRSHEYPWSNAPLSSKQVNHSEDDNFPEHIVNIEVLLRDIDKKRPGMHQLQTKLNAIENVKERITIKDYNLQEDMALAKQLVDTFFEMPGKKLFSDPHDYYNMIQHPPAGTQGKDYFAKLVLFDGKPIGFCMAERIGDETVALNAHLLVDRIDGLSEYVYMQLFREMVDKGIRYANFGGSETESLAHYKKMFNPSLESKQHYWLAYKPENTRERITRHLAKQWIPYVTAAALVMGGIIGYT